MKKLTLVKTLVLGLTGYIVISGYKAGPAAAAGYDCTGAESIFGNPTGCSAGGGCHASSATSSIGLTLELDSTGGVPTTRYSSGLTYKIKISGVNNTLVSLPKFGFQVSAIVGPSPQTSPTNAGTFPAPYPPSVHFRGPLANNYVANIVEHLTPISPTTGTGGPGSTYVETITWKAPATGTGTISIYAALNCVNNNGNADNGDQWNVASMVINEGPAGINELSKNSEAKVYPNPFSLHTTFTLGTEVEKAVLTVYDITGKEVKQIQFSGKDVILQRDNLTSGLYIYNITSVGNTVTTGKLIIQ